MNIAISGSRSIVGGDYIQNCIETVIQITGFNLHFITGCSRDFDKIVEGFFKRELHSFECVDLHFCKPGRAVFARRHKMLEKSDALIAIFDNDSKGTRDLIDLFLEKQKIVYAFQDGNFEILGGYDDTTL